MIETKYPTKSLRINAPGFALTLVELDTDQGLMPAVKVSVTCTIDHPSGTFSYQADDIWIDFESLENFISALGHLSHTAQDYASLSCIERTLKLEITRQPEIFKVRLSFVEHLPGQEDIKLNASFDFDDLNLLQTWYHDFSEFRR